MGQRSIRFPDELEARLVAAAELDGRTFSNFVVRALESALGGHTSPGARGPCLPQRAEEQAVQSSRSVPAPSRAPAAKRPPSRQELLNQAKYGRSK